MNATPQMIAGVLGTIEEHHGDEIAWVQHISSDFNP
jgi:hypothetical protein